MDLLSISFLLCVFLFVATLAEVAWLAFSRNRYKERYAIKKRLLYMSAGGQHGREKLSLYKNRALKDVGLIERLAYSLPRLRGLDRKLLRAGFNLNASTFILASIAFAGIGFLLGLNYFPHWTAALLPAGTLLYLPWLYLKQREKRALFRFDEQLPEAIDLLGRSLRSGIALSGGMEIITQESEDPIRSEFAATVDEINLGLSFKEALENMCERIPSRDLRMFAVAIMIQRDTGGNVAEILDQISLLMRERIKFKRQVKTLTAEGRLSGLVLIGLPVALFFYLYLTKYEYVSLLWTDKAGYFMMAFSLISMAFGTLVIKSIVKIDM